MYALPNESKYFRFKIHPHLIPWLLPITQIAMMSSVYCTIGKLQKYGTSSLLFKVSSKFLTQLILIFCSIVMSFERYVRICYLCQLRISNVLTEENFKYYVLAFTLGPLLFYMPKFFELRTEERIVEHSKQINCTDILKELFKHPYFLNST